MLLKRKNIAIACMLAACVLSCKNTDSSSFDPMFDSRCHVQQKERGDEWPGAYMWHPGQLAAWLQADNLARSKGRCVNVGYPGSFYRKSESTLFRADTDLGNAGTLEWRSTGEVQLTLDGKVQACNGNQFEIPAGRHNLQILVTTQSRVPALIVMGGGLEDENCWTASTDGENWSPVESDSRYCCPESFPDEAQEVLVTIPQEGKIRLADGEQRLIDFKYLELGYVRMHVKGDARLAFCVGETPEEARNTDIRGFEQYALDTLTIKGEQDISLKERALRYLNISAVEGECTISNLRFDAEMWPVTPEMAFECDDEEFNVIFNAAKATMHTCMHNFYLDGVKRDFLPWALDAVLSSIGADFAFGDRQMSRNGISIALLPDNPRKEDIGVCDYPLHALIGLQQEYLRYGDLKTSLMFQKRIIDQMSVYMSLQDENGFISSSEDDWGFIPGWNLQNGPDRNGTPAYAQMLLMENFRIAARFAGLWEMPELAEIYAARAAFLEKSIKDHFWDAERRVFINGLNPDGSRDERISHHSQYWAVLTGLYPETEYRHLFNEVYPSIPDYFGDVSFEKGYEAIAFAKAGYMSEFMDIMKRIFGVWLEKGHTRFPENFMVGESEAKQLEFYDRPFGLSLCHGANGVAPICAVVYGLFGFRQDMEHPGEYTVSPKLFNLKHMKGYFPVKEGRIAIEVTEDGKVKVDAPENCTVHISN